MEENLNNLSEDALLLGTSEYFICTYFVINVQSYKNKVWKLKLHFLFPDSLLVPVFHRILAENDVG